MSNDKADSFLRMIRRSQRGRLKVYLGYCAGVGKTYEMLQDAHRMKDEGIDVVVGYVETHGRADTQALLDGLEVLPRMRQEYRGITVEEMDVNLILARNPTVVLIDELAHTNVPGSRNAKRYEDVQDILSHGIHVISTLNVQHLESLYDAVEHATGIRVRERIPDSVLSEADQIVNVDVSSEDLRKRLAEGKVYPRERVEGALANFFAPANLEQLRELALRELAAQIDSRRRQPTDEEKSVSPDQVMVCLSSRGPQSERLLRYGSRLAGRLNRNWYAVYVQTPRESATRIDAETQRELSGTLTLAKQLGAIVFTYKGGDVVSAIGSFVKEYRVGHIVIGTPAPLPWWKRVFGRKDILERLTDKVRDTTVVVVDTRRAPERQESASVESAKGGHEGQTRMVETDAARLRSLLATNGVVIWEEPVAKDILLRKLVEAIDVESVGVSTESVFARIVERESQGSTFFNEGVAFPHARIDGLQQPILALGITHGGVSDESTGKPIELVFLTLCPADTPALQVELLALASRTAKDRRFARAARTAKESAALLEALTYPED
ncbi:MAG: PTS sugar transporter subunit IIA [Candidatus Hydrogenedentes bacterium]|nr:PTS sugar transporter subunit IIA [Candidatus Hydrogenedentota bacterium]